MYINRNTKGLLTVRNYRKRNRVGGAQSLRSHSTSFAFAVRITTMAAPLRKNTCLGFEFGLGIRLANSP